MISSLRSCRLLTFVFVVWFLSCDLLAADKSKTPSPAESKQPNVQPPENLDLEFISRLREEEFQHSKVMDIMSDLTDKIGPRLTGSPNMKKANEWTRDELTKFGLVNAHVEPWGTFGRGWAYQSCEVRMVSPDYMQFLALPEAWTPGTNGPVHGEVIQVIAKEPADLEKYRGKLAGKIVLLGEARVPDPIEKPLFRRDDAQALERIATYEMPPAQPEARREEGIKHYRFTQALEKFLNDEHPAAVLEITRQPGQDGTIFVQAGGPYEAGK